MIYTFEYRILIAINKTYKKLAKKDYCVDVIVSEAQYNIINLAEITNLLFYWAATQLIKCYVLDY